MYIVNLTKTAIVNVDTCIAVKRTENKIVAITSQGHPDCPYAMTLATYHTKEIAETVFENLLKAIQTKTNYYEMPEIC